MLLTITYARAYCIRHIGGGGDKKCSNLRDVIFKCPLMYFSGLELTTEAPVPVIHQGQVRTGFYKKILNTQPLCAVFEAFLVYIK